MIWWATLNSIAKNWLKIHCILLFPCLVSTGNNSAEEDSCEEGNDNDQPNEDNQQVSNDGHGEFHV